MLYGRSGKNSTIFLCTIFVREKSPVVNTIEKIVKDGEKKCVAMIALNYRTERQKNNIIFLIFEAFFENRHEKL